MHLVVKKNAAKGRQENGKLATLTHIYPFSAFFYIQKRPSFNSMQSIRESKKPVIIFLQELVLDKVYCILATNFIRRFHIKSL
jgi:hypothetical protein